MGFLDKLSHNVRVVGSKLRELKKTSSRSPHWKTVRNNFLETHGKCAICLSDDNIQVHHKEPFNEKPELELEESNLITLCMGSNECHLKIGHGGSFDYFNPNIDKDVESISNGAKISEIAIFALKNRLVNKPQK